MTQNGDKLMYFTVYKTTNIVNGKIYVGSHKTDNINDEYLGSGKYLTRSIQKYGKENFKKEILQIFDNPDDMFILEAKIVDENFVKRDDTYNMKIGGYGGWDHINSKPRKPISDETRLKMSKAKKDRMLKENNHFYGKKHSEHSKFLIGEKSRERAKTQYEERLKIGNHPNNFVNCPHCGKYGQFRAMKRWHFDNCKLKKTF